MAYQSRLSLLSLIAAVFLSILNTAAIVIAADEQVAIFEQEQPQSILRTTPWNDRALMRELQLTEGKCWSTRDDRNPNRYCMFEDTPRSGAFLSLSCPTARDDMAKCQCTIGIGDSQDAPNTDTCWKCGFCRDGSLAYDCRNIAEGTCIGRNCLDDCLSSYNDPEDLLLGSSAKAASFFLAPSIVASILLFLA